MHELCKGDLGKYLTTNADRDYLPGRHHEQPRDIPRTCTCGRGYASATGWSTSSDARRVCWNAFLDY